MSLLVDNDGGAFYLVNKSGSHVVESYASPEGDGLLILSDRDARTRLESIGSQAAGTLRFWDDTNRENPVRILDSTTEPDAE